MRRVFFFLLLASALVYCSSENDVPNDIIPPDKMQAIIFDLLRADEFVNNFVLKDTSLNRDREATKLYQQVFTIHKVEKEQFYKSYQYYQGHPDKNKAMIDSLANRRTRPVNLTPPATLRKPVTAE